VLQHVPHDGQRQAHLVDRVPSAERPPDAWKWRVLETFCAEVMLRENATQEIDQTGN